ncbi:MAG: type II toxin-antitoxin system HicA family toxin [Bacteroidaceae bacterium]|nr:type II toxin-antitoxin system HicA family toxin [Bacteroidaceae bacterium]
MKNSELKRKLWKAGCYPLRQGARHEIWINPKTGATTTVPRHDAQEVKTKTACSIFKELLGK